MTYAELAPTLRAWSQRIGESLGGCADKVEVLNAAGPAAQELILRLIDDPDFDPASARADTKVTAIVFLELVHRVFSAASAKLPTHLAVLSPGDAARILLREKIQQASLLGGITNLKSR